MSSEKIYAYAWFRRLHLNGPGNWKPCDAPQMAHVIKRLHRDKIDDPGAGNIVYGTSISSRYDLIYVKVEIPASVIEGLEEV